MKGGWRSDSFKGKGLLYIQIFFHKSNGDHIQQPPKLTHNFNKGRRDRGKKYEIPPNKNNRQKHKGRKNNGVTELPDKKAKMAIENPHTSIITLNVNGLSSPIKRHRVAN